jgi:hypothetical protein
MNNEQMIDYKFDYFLSEFLLSNISCVNIRHYHQNFYHEKQ